MEILVHLNVEAPESETRTADQIASAIMDAISVGSDHESLKGLTIVCPLAEQIG